MTDKVNVSSIVSSQFPSFIREDYEAFVAFVKSYYEFLEQDYSTDLRTIRDIDTTLDSYIKHFKSEYASNIPFILADERFILQNIKDLNLAKGSEQSFRLLFRLLFDKEITISYPSTQMLRASDGRWEQKVSIFVAIVKGNPEDIVGNTIDIITSTGPIKTTVHSYKNLHITIDGKDVYELFIHRRFFGNVGINDRVLHDSIFIARVLPTISNVKVLQSGKNFNVGELYEIGTTGTILKIVKTDSIGAILYAQVINYSMDTKFSIDYIYELISKFDAAKNLAIADFTIAVPGSIADKDLGMADYIKEYTEFGVINSYDYNVDIDITGSALDPSYAGTMLRTFGDSNRTEVLDLSIVAYLDIQIGALSKYPGYYTSNNGFLDDAMYIQDSRFYQAYSYVLQIDEKLAAYKDAVKTLIHPAGMAMFGEYTIINEFDLTEELESMVKSLIIVLKNSAVITDTKDHFEITKPLSDTLDPATDQSIWSFDKGLNDTLDPMIDGKDYFVVDKLLSDTLATTIDSKDYFVVDKLLSDTASISETMLLYLNGEALYYKYDTQVLTDSGTVWKNAYLEDMSTFANDGADYMENKISIF